MSAKKIALLLTLFPLLLVGCTPRDNATQEDAIPPISVQISKSLTHWLPKINACADTLDQSGIVVDVLPYPSIIPADADLTIYPGFKTDQQENISLVFLDRIIVIASSDTPVSEINLQSLADIFKGNYSNWNQLPELAASEKNINLPINIFAYGDSSDLTLALQKIYLDEQPIDSEAMYVPSWEVMLEKVDGTPGSIGFVLESHLQAQKVYSYNILTISTSALAELPIIALVNAPPQGNLRQLLLCLQAAE